MVIIHIIPSLGYGGAEKFCIELANEQCKSNTVHLISLFDYDVNSMLPLELINDNVRVHFLSKKSGFDIKIVGKLFKLVENLKPHVVNTHLNALLYVGMICLFFRKTQFFHTVHNLAEREVGALIGRIYFLYFNFFAITPISISKQVLDSVLSRYGSKHNYLIYNGISRVVKSSQYDFVLTEISKIKKDCNRLFLNIGRINSQKNQKELLRVFSKYKEISLIILGNADKNNTALEEELIRMCPDNVHFIGVRDNIGDYLYACDFFILSSLYEGMPITLIEALSIGKVTLCTPVGGIVDIIENGINGLLASDVSSDAIETLILDSLILSESEQKIINTNSVLTFNKYLSIEGCAENYIKLYQRHNK